MPNLYTLETKKIHSGLDLNESEKFSILYHNIFDFPLSFKDLIRWRSGYSPLSLNDTAMLNKKGFYYPEGREALVYKSLLRKRISAQKRIIANRAANILKFIPTIKLIALTGSLAMENSSDESDVDLMIVTTKNTLWLTRLMTLFLFGVLRVPTRHAGKLDQKDKLCLNMWLDESDLLWRTSDRNFYTAHEVAQIVPLLNRNSTYEKFLNKNIWILDYWPNSVKISNSKYHNQNKSKILNSKYLKNVSDFVFRTSNTFFYGLQKKYMQNKITREVITPTRALFHPQDWGKVVMERLGISN